MQRSAYSPGGSSRALKAPHVNPLTGRTELHDACAEPRGAEAIIAALRAGPEAAKMRDFEGKLPLHLAAHARAPVEAIVALLKEDEAAAAETDPEGRTPLHFALSFFPEKVPAEAEGQHAELLEVGTLVRASGSAPGGLLLSKDHLVPRMFAPFGGCLGKVQKVIKHVRAPYKVTFDNQSSSDFDWYEREELVLSDGVSAVPEVLEALLAAAPETLRQRDGGGRLPLHYAAGGAVSVALFLKLLHAGAPEDASLRDDKGFLPLHYAAIERAPPAKVEALLGAPGVDACVWESSIRLTPLHFACEFGAPQESTLAILQKGLPAAGQFSLARSLPLHHACGLPPAVVGPLLAAFPDAARERTVDGSLALHCLVSSPNANLESVQLVLGAFPAAILEKNEAGETALLLACKHQAPLPLIKHLHALHPAAIREKNEQGHFPAHLAVQAAHAPVQPALVSFLATENKIAFKAVDSEGMTPLHLAVNTSGAEKEVLVSVAALFKEVVSQSDNKGNLPLHLAAGCGHSPDVLAILNKDGAATRANGEGNLPLHMFKGGEKSAAGVRYLLSVNEGAVRVTNAAGELPLHRACKAGAGVEVLQCLLDAFPGAATVLSDDLMSPLHHAAAGQAPKPSVELLLSAFPAGAKAAASAKTKKDGYLPLHFAVEKTTRVRPGVVKVLLDAFPEAAQVQTKKHHRYPLYLAAAGAPPRVLEWLIKANPAALEAKELEFSHVPLHRAVLNATTAGTCSIAVLVNAWKEGAAQPEKDDNLPLHFVRAGTAAASTEILLRANPAAVDAANNSGRLPLHSAAWRAAPKTSVALLLNEAAARTPDKDKSLPLHLAVTENQHDVVQLLLDSFPQGVECVDKNNRTPLKRCFDGSSRGDTVKLLIQRFPKAASIRSETGQKEFPIFNAVNARFLPPDVLEAVHCAADHAATSLIGYDFNLLHFACWGKAPAGTLQEIIRLAPLSPSQRDNAKRIPLHFGASSKAAMEVLLSCSPPDAPRLKSSTGTTPLHSFAYHWDPKVEAFEALLSRDKGAASELDDDDASPLHVACGLTSSAEDDRRPRKLAVISALLEAYPAATAIKTKADGYLPLHVACKYKANADVIGALLAKGKGTEKMPSKQLFLPLHLALDYGAPHASSAALLKAYPGAAAIANPEGRLPLHLALAPTKAWQAPEDLVRTIFELNPAAARVRDNEDMEPLARLQKRIKDTGSSGAYSGELLGQIMMRCLPFDPATGEAHAATGVGEAPCYVWHAVLADCEDKLVAGVEEVLRLCPSRVEALAFSLDSHGRRAIDRATPRCKAAIIRRLFLCGRFELSPGPPEHVSATSIVRFATDYAKEAAPAAPEAASPTPPATLGSEGGSPVAAAAAAAAASAPAAPAEQLPLVCLKFLKHRENFQRELEARRCPLHGETSPDHVVPILASFDGMSDPDFAEELAGRGLSSHPYLLVFPAGDRPLSAVIDHERETKDWEEEVRSCAAALSVGLAHLHSRGVIHGDVKPRNVVRVGRRYKLIDLDASTRFGEEVGIKTSTALAPPELLCVGATGKVVVRSSAAGGSGGGGGGGGGGEAATPLLAHPSFDVWMLGATLYHMLTGATLLHATASDNAADEAQLRLAAEWAAEDKAAKLAAVQPPRARHLLSLLLSRDQALRPSAERVAQHPFITGKQAVRLSGEVPAFDVFLSYRVASEAPLAQALYEKLVARGCRVWWDKRCLSLGKDWREGFCAGLATSRAFVALLSRGAVAACDAATQKPLAGRNWGADALNRGSPCDNVLLEHRLALELAHPERGLLEFIIPVFIGDPSEGDPELHDKWGASCAPVPNDESCAAVDEELARQLDKQGLGAPFDSAMGTAAVWRAVGGKQGHFVAGRRGDALDAVAKAIWEALQGPPPGAPAAPLAIAIPAEEGSEAVAGACAGGGEAAAAAAQARNKELTLSVRTLQEEARALRGRVAQTEALQAQTEALRAHAAALEGAAAAARSEAQGLQARLVRAEAAAAAAAPPPAPARAAPDPALASELGEARRLLEKGAAEAAELRRSAVGAKAEEERLRAALALASGRAAALEQELAARPAPAPPAGASAEEERLRAALALSADKAAALERELAASAARAGALEARGAGAAPSPPPAYSEAAEPYAPASPLGRPLLAAASPSGRHRLAASGGGAGAGLLEQAVSEQQTFSAQLQGQLLVQGQLIMSLQRDIMELRGSLRR